MKDGERSPSQATETVMEPLTKSFGEGKHGAGLWTVFRNLWWNPAVKTRGDGSDGQGESGLHTGEGGKSIESNSRPWVETFYLGRLRNGERRYEGNLERWGMRKQPGQGGEMVFQSQGCHFEK